MQHGREQDEIKDYVTTILQANMTAITSECDGLAAMLATAFGRVESRLDSIELRLECIESLIEYPNRIPMQHFILHPEEKLIK